MGRGPIIIVGMGRSGTAFLVEALELLGARMGVRQDLNRESLPFLSLNRRIFASAGGRMDRPEPVLEALGSPGGAELARIAAEGTSGVSGASHLGAGRWLRRTTLDDIDLPWGWKDPRNTITLPLWLERFPQARIIHITRHGVDVAASLRAFTSSMRKAPPPSRTVSLVPELSRGRKVLVPRRLRGWVAEMDRFETIAPGIELWALYTGVARGHVESLGERALELRYEDLLAEPRERAAQIAGFCSLPIVEAALDEIAARANPAKAFSYRRDAELAAEAAKAADVLLAYGYRADT